MVFYIDKLLELCRADTAENTMESVFLGGTYRK